MAKMSITQIARQRVININDYLWGEDVKHCPLINGKTDVSRQETIIFGVLRTDEENIKKADGGTSNGWNVPVSAIGAKLSIDRKKYPNLAICEGDRIETISREKPLWYDVKSVNSRSHHRLYVFLNQA